MLRFHTMCTISDTLQQVTLIFYVEKVQVPGVYTLNKGHYGANNLVPCREVVPISEGPSSEVPLLCASPLSLPFPPLPPSHLSPSSPSPSDIWCRNSPRSVYLCLHEEIQRGRLCGRRLRVLITPSIHVLYDYHVLLILTCVPSLTDNMHHSISVCLFSIRLRYYYNLHN